MNGKPVCPTCNRSNGITVEVGTSVTWRNGDWRFDHPPEFSGAAMWCNHCDEPIYEEQNP